jgi:Zn-dependent protease with chaperone function
MVRRISLVVPFLLLAFPAFAAAPVLTVTGRDGHRETFAFDDFDNKRLMFQLKVGTKDRELDLLGVSAIQFPPHDTATVSPTSDSLDVFTMVDGKTVRGVFRRMDDQKVYANLVEGGDKQLRLGSLRQIAFSPAVLDVDRREFGKGFNLFGDDIEVELAKGFASEIESDAEVLDDSKVEQYVSDLGLRVAASSKRPDLPYEFKVVNSGQVNAFTVGGGKVYVYRGLLEQMGSESDLAGVLAHEIGHNVGKHTVKQLSKTLLMKGIVGATGALVKTKNSEWGEALDGLGGAVTYFMTLKYSRDDEREADFLAVYNLHAQGMDPNGMVSAFEALKSNQAREPSKFEVFFQTHPSFEERIENTSTEIPRLKTANMRKDSPAFRAMKEHLLSLPRPIAKQVLLADTLSIEASVKRAWSWKIDTTVLKDCTLKGQFRAYGGSGNDIRVLVLDEMNYQNFWNGHKATALYDSGVLTTAEFKVPLSATGTYHLVLDNTFSMFTNKAVALNLVAEHTE